MVLAFGSYTLAGHGAWKGKRLSVGGTASLTRPAFATEDGLVHSAQWDAGLPYCRMSFFHPNFQVVESNSVDQLKNSFSRLFGEEKILKKYFGAEGLLAVRKLKKEADH